MLRIPSLYIQYDDRTGRGVYTGQIINPEDIIEVCPILLIPKDQVQLIHQTVLHDYYFLWGENHQEAAIALGFGSLYNHQSQANAIVILDYENEEIVIQACQKIDVGEQIFINYNDGDVKQIELWFSTK